MSIALFMSLSFCCKSILLSTMLELKEEVEEECDLVWTRSLLASLARRDEFLEALMETWLLLPPVRFLVVWLSVLLSFLG